MILLVRHPPVNAGGRCYGRLDLDVADLASVAELAAQMAALLRTNANNDVPLSSRLGLGEGWPRPEPSALAETCGAFRARGTPSPGPLPQGEREQTFPRVSCAGWTIWTSPARRCRLVAEALGPHRVDHRLQELDFGEWEGISWDDVPRAALDAWGTDPWSFAPPQGESGAQLVARVRSFAGGCGEDNHILITHGGPLKVLTAILRGATVDLLSPAPAPGSITLIAP